MMLLVGNGFDKAENLSSAISRILNFLKKYSTAFLLYSVIQRSIVVHLRNKESLVTPAFMRASFFFYM